MSRILNKNFLLVFSVFLLVAMISFSIPLSIHAQNDSDGGTKAIIVNPLGSTNDIPTLIKIIVDQAINFGYFLVVFFVLYSGFLFVKARGDEAGIEKAKKAFLWTVIGAAVLLGAQIISGVISGTVEQLKTGYRAPITYIDTV